MLNQTKFLNHSSRPTSQNRAYLDLSSVRALLAPLAPFSVTITTIQQAAIYSHCQANLYLEG